MDLKDPVAMDLKDSEARASLWDLCKRVRAQFTLLLFVDNCLHPTPDQTSLWHINITDIFVSHSLSFTIVQ